MLRYKTKPSLVAFYDIGQEMERVYSYNSGARTGHFRQNITKMLDRQYSIIAATRMIKSCIVRQSSDKGFAN